jgi:bifunctional DNA-binding transcriptional regulator/antitoxin component of YhaV-PrlF toxin-antitoxin module
VTTGAQTPLPSETVTLSPEGHVRLPDRLRHLLGWQEGDKLVLTVDDRGDVKVLTVHESSHFAKAGIKGTGTLQMPTMTMASRR